MLHNKTDVDVQGPHFEQQARTCAFLILHLHALDKDCFSCPAPTHSYANTNLPSQAREKK